MSNRSAVAAMMSGRVLPIVLVVMVAGVGCTVVQHHEVQQPPAAPSPASPYTPSPASPTTPPPQQSPSASPSAPAPAPIPFNDMRAFITGYYDQLPANPMDAWKKLGAGYQQRVGLNDYVKFWSTVRSVKVITVAPRGTNSVTAHLEYVGNDGRTFTEDRSFRIVLQGGALRIGDSEKLT